MWYYLKCQKNNEDPGVGADGVVPALVIHEYLHDQFIQIQLGSRHLRTLLGYPSRELEVWVGRDLFDQKAEGRLVTSFKDGVCE